MRLRLRGPAGASTVTLDDNATVRDLISAITENTGVTKFDVRYGYPPKPLVLDQEDRLLSDLDIKLDGEQLTIASKDEPVADAGRKQVSSSSAAREESPRQIALQKKAMEGDVPEIPMPERGATLGKDKRIFFGYGID